MLTEKLDHHRGRGQQQIVVKHVTVNADQAVITDQILAGERSTAGGPSPSPALVTAKVELPMQELGGTEVSGLKQGEVSRRNEHQPHAKGPRRTAMHGQIKADWETMSCACGARLEGLPDARRSRWRTGGQTQWKLSAWRPLEGNDRALEAH